MMDAVNAALGVVGLAALGRNVLALHRSGSADAASPAAVAFFCCGCTWGVAYIAWLGQWLTAGVAVGNALLHYAWLAVLLRNGRRAAARAAGS